MRTLRAPSGVTRTGGANVYAAKLATIIPVVSHPPRMRDVALPSPKTTARTWRTIERAATRAVFWETHRLTFPPTIPDSGDTKDFRKQRYRPPRLSDPTDGSALGKGERQLARHLFGYNCAGPDGG
jgi:hypothetical protein